jgi:hypothetical protein
VNVLRSDKIPDVVLVQNVIMSYLCVQASTSHDCVQSKNWLTEVLCSQKQNFPLSEMSDCVYATRMENQEYVSTSSNEDEGPHAKRC